MTLDLAKLSQLSDLTITEPEKISKNLEEIATYFAVLDNLDTENIEPTFQVTGLKNILREDLVIDTPPIHQGCFVTDILVNRNG